MKLKSQSGFSHIALVLILLVLAGIGFAGWKVYGARKPSSPPATNATSTPKQDQSTIPDGFIEYENKDLGFKFAYPKDWQTVPVSEDGKKHGLVLKLVSPEQKKAFEDFAKLDRATEGPSSFDLEVSKWPSINDENAKAGSYLDEPSSYKNLEDYLTHQGSIKQKVGELMLGNQKAFEVYAAGLSQSYAIMWEKQDGSINEIGFINVSDKSEIDQITKKIIDSIQVL